VKKKIFLLVNILIVVTLTACTTPTPEVIEKIVTQVVTQVVKETVKETVTVVVTKVVEKEVVVTATPEPDVEKETVVPLVTETVVEIFTEAHEAPMRLSVHPPLSQAAFWPNECFVLDQIIVTGPKTAIEKADSLPSIPNIRWTGRRLYVSDYFGENLTKVVSPPILPWFPVDKYSELVIDLYQITDGAPVPNMVAAINNQFNDRSIYADPNYLTGQPDIPVRGSSWLVFGSPFVGEKASASATEFAQQWAFTQRGIELIELLDNNKVNRKTELTGKGVLVGVFDTVPPGLGEVHAGRTPLGPKDISDHGLFVAGLVYGVAPESDIHLYQVLDEYGRGSLYMLLEALDQFFREFLIQRVGQGIVVNLSLGLHQSAQSQTGCPVDDYAIESLLTQLVGAHRVGVVVVAASGNTGARYPDIPADWYPFVMGVAASNDNGGAACFSNPGNVLAPGGDGDEDEDECQPMADPLISLATASPTGYAKWTGTSFATPLVSGLAALILQQEEGLFGNIYAASGSWMTPTVMRAIYCSAGWTEDVFPETLDEGYNIGVINVPRALEDCLLKEGALILLFDQEIDDLTYGAEIGSGTLTGLIGNEPIVTRICNWTGFDITLRRDETGDAYTLEPWEAILVFANDIPLEGSWIVEASSVPYFREVEIYWKESE
jgi:subtilisin family serine protease